MEMAGASTMGRTIFVGGMSQSHVARSVLGENKSSNTVLAWEKDRSLPGGENLFALRALLAVDGHYLLTGEGTPEGARPGRDTALVSVIKKMLDPELTDAQVIEIANNLMAGDE